jgi:hypothetical protein
MKTMTPLTPQFVWSITDLERRVADGYVVKPYWKLEGTQGVFTVYRSGSLNFPDGSPDIPYESVTETIAVGWVIDNIGPNGVEELQRSISAELDQLINPVYSFGLPWLPTAEPQITPELTVLNFVEGQSAQ